MVDWAARTEEGTRTACAISAQRNAEQREGHGWMRMAQSEASWRGLVTEAAVKEHGDGGSHHVILMVAA